MAASCGLLWPLTATAAPIALRDDAGTEIRLAAPAQRVISLMPSLTESVCALGACARLVGVDRYSNHPEAVQALPRLGGLEDAQVERIVALKPDVVLASRSARVTERLRGLGLTVALFESDTHADVKRSLEKIALLLGTPEAGPQLWERLDRDITAAAARVPPALRGSRVYFEIGGGAWAAGEASFIGQTLSRLGLVHVVPTSLGPFPKLNPEHVLRHPPDVVMASQREVRGMPQRPGWNALPAVREQRLCGFDTRAYDVLVRPGPRLGEAAHLLAGCLEGLSR